MANGENAPHPVKDLEMAERRRLKLNDGGRLANRRRAISMSSTITDLIRQHPL
jgi:hypothetical protein